MITKKVEHHLRRVFSGEYECLNAPDEDVQLGEVVVGTLRNEQAKALFSIVRDIGKNLDLNTKDLERRFHAATDKEEQRQVFREIHQIKNQVGVIMGLFWEMVYEEYPQGRDRELDVGIRRDWQVVVYKATSPLSGIFGELFG